MPAEKKFNYPYRHYAEKHGVSIRKLSALAKRGVNLDQYFDSLGKGEPITNNLKRNPPKSDEESIIVNAKAGAAEALKRLEMEEASLYEKMKAANNQSDKKHYLDQWLKVGGELRKYEVLIEEARRDAGVLIPKEDCERSCRMAGVWLRLSVIKYLSAHAPDLRDQTDTAVIFEKVVTGLSDSLDAIIENAKKTASMPDWALREIRKGYGNDLTA